MILTCQCVLVTIQYMLSVVFDRLPLYLDVVPRQRGLSIVDPLGSPSVLPQIGRSHSSRLSCSSYNTPDIFPTPSASPTVEETSHDNIPISHEVSHDDTSINIICSNELVQSNQTKNIWDHNDIDDETNSETNCKITIDSSLSNGDHNHFMPNQPIALSRHMSLDNLASLPSSHSLVVSMERKKPHAPLPTLNLPSQGRNYTDEHDFYTPLTGIGIHVLYVLILIYYFLFQLHFIIASQPLHSFHLIIY